MKKINGLLLIFCTGFLLSSIFHLFVNVIPAIRKRKITESIIKSRLKDLIQEVHILIEYIYLRNEFSPETQKIEQIVFKEDFPSDKSIKYTELIPISGFKEYDKLVVASETTEYNFLSDRINKIKESADFIVNLPFISTIDFELIKLIVTLSNCEFLDLLLKEMDENVTEKSDDDDIFFPSAYIQPLKDFIRDYEKIKKKLEFVKTNINELKVEK